MFRSCCFSREIGRKATEFSDNKKFFCVFIDFFAASGYYNSNSNFTSVSGLKRRGVYDGRAFIIVFDYIGSGSFVC